MSISTSSDRKFTCHIKNLLRFRTMVSINVKCLLLNRGYLKNMCVKVSRTGRAHSHIRGTEERGGTLSEVRVTFLKCRFSQKITEIRTKYSFLRGVNPYQDVSDTVDLEQDSRRGSRWLKEKKYT